MPRRRGGRNHNKNRVPIQVSVGEEKNDDCPVCLEPLKDGSGVTFCSEKHGVCNGCIKGLLTPCVAAWRGSCDCCGVSWKCPLCRKQAGIPNAFSLLLMILPKEETDKMIDRANE